jgi:hypothetical protein
MKSEQEEYLARKVEKINPQWLSSGQFVRNLEKLNVVNRKMFVIISSVPKTLQYILAISLLSTLGIYFKLIFDIFYHG